MSQNEEINSENPSLDDAHSKRKRKELLRDEVNKRKSKQGKFPKRQGASAGRKLRDRVKVTWDVPSGQDHSYETLIEGYSDMSSVDKLKAKTKYLTDKYGSLAQLGEGAKYRDQLATLVDEEDVHNGITERLNSEEPSRDLDHEDAIFGGNDVQKNIKTNEKNSHEEAVVTEEIVQSQMTTSWRERAVWRRQQRLKHLSDKS